MYVYARVLGARICYKRSGVPLARVRHRCCACAIEAVDHGTQNATAFGLLYLKVQQLHGPCLSGVRHTDGRRLRSQPL